MCADRAVTVTIAASSVPEPPMRQLVLDTETTGLSVEQGHRIIEVGVIELVNRRATGNHFHRYVNPGREVEAGAINVHGITNEFLADKPRFAEIAKDLWDWLGGDELIIHNAPFDVGFLDVEFRLSGIGRPLADVGKITDTVQMARKLHPGQKASLDASTTPTATCTVRCSTRACSPTCIWP
jgi:DNA polymerase III subunit epsilon